MSLYLSKQFLSLDRNDAAYAFGIGACVLSSKFEARFSMVPLMQKLATLPLKIANH